MTGGPRVGPHGRADAIGERRHPEVIQTQHTTIEQNRKQQKSDIELNFKKTKEIIQRLKAKGKPSASKHFQWGMFSIPIINMFTKGARVSDNPHHMIFILCSICGSISRRTATGWPQTITPSRLGQHQQQQTVDVTPAAAVVIAREELHTNHKKVNASLSSLLACVSESDMWVVQSHPKIGNLVARVDEWVRGVETD